jgi:hypothetical protein
MDATQCATAQSVDGGRRRLPGSSRPSWLSEQGTGRERFGYYPRVKFDDLALSIKAPRHRPDRV